MLGPLVSALILANLAAPAPEPKEALVTAELLADVKAVQPGRPFHIGVLYKVRPGWHIYWKYAGDAGMPTLVKFRLPDGFRLEEADYPVPITFMQPGDIIGYGYEDSLMLLARVHPPRDLPAGEPVEILAQTSWLACQRVCIPGQTDLKLELPVDRSAQPANQEIFARWLQELPVAAEGKDSPLRAQANGQLSSRGDGTFQIVLDWRDPVRDVNWLPQPPASLIVEDLQVRTQGSQSRVTFAARVLAGHKLDENVLPSLVTYEDAQGRRRGVAVPILLRSQATQPTMPASAAY